MELAITIVPDEKTIKQVDDYRFQYDRELLKDFHPYITLVGPMFYTASLKSLSDYVDNFVRKNVKPFKIQVNGMTDELVDKGKVAFNIVQDKKLESLHSQFCNPDWFRYEFQNGNSKLIPHIVIYNSENSDDTSEIYDDLKDVKFKHNFTFRRIDIKVKDANSKWETFKSYDL